jgi:stringent starvation protein B
VPRGGNVVVCATKADNAFDDFAGSLEMEKQSSTRPYLLRAFYAWIVDNQLTPHLIVDTTRPGVVVPQQYVKNGKIILNISPAAVHGLKIDNTSIEFSGRFGGTAYGILVPLTAVEAIYSKENGKGMVFAPEPDSAKRPAPRKPVLKLIK